MEMEHRKLEAFEESLSSVINNYVEGNSDLDDVLYMADKVMCYKANVGINAKRLPHNPTEQAFHDQWQQENAPVGGVNSGHGILQDLFIEENFLNPLQGRRVLEEISNWDRKIVATVIQWLGSNVGMCFLNDSLSRIGAQITYTKRTSTTDKTN